MAILTMFDKKRLVVCFLLFTLSLLAYKTWEMQSNGLTTYRRGKNSEDTIAFRNNPTLVPLRILLLILFAFHFFAERYSLRFQNEEFRGTSKKLRHIGCD